MPKLRPCSWCGGMHRKKSAVKKCYDKNAPKKKWTKAEIGRT